MKRLTIILATLALLSGCTKDIEYRGTDRGPVMVANSMNRAGDKAYVRVTRSRYFLDPGNADYSLDNATVSMTVNGQEHNLTFDSESRRYTSDLTILPGSTLDISVSHPDYGYAGASDTVPTDILCSVDTVYRTFDMKGVKIDTIYYQGLDIGSVDSVCVFDFGLVPDSTKDDFFMLEFEPVRTVYFTHGDTLDTQYQDLSFRIPTNSLIAMERLDPESLGDFAEMMNLLPFVCTGAHSFTFTDGHLSDTTHLKFELLMTPVDSTLDVIRSDVQAKYSIRSLSWAAFTYQMAVRNFSSHNGPMSEPVTMWTNIQGDGTGVLGSYVEIRDSLSLIRF